LKSAREEPLVSCVVGVLALAGRLRGVGRFAILFTEEERQKLLSDFDVP
jgi:hypothetical protein